MNRNERAAEVLRLKKEASQYKHNLMDLEKRIRELSKTEADKLDRIIGRLEHWQNT